MIFPGPDIQVPWFFRDFGLLFSNSMIFACLEKGVLWRWEPCNPAFIYSGLKEGWCTCITCIHHNHTHEWSLGLQILAKTIFWPCTKLKCSRKLSWERSRSLVCICSVDACISFQNQLRWVMQNPHGITGPVSRPLYRHGCSKLYCPPPLFYILPWLYIEEWQQLVEKPIKVMDSPPLW